jgi:hypothetical protein
MGAEANTRRREKYHVDVVIRIIRWNGMVNKLLNKNIYRGTADSDNYKVSMLGVRQTRETGKGDVVGK